MGLLSVIMVLCAGCASKPVGEPGYRADRKERLPKGCVFYMDGVGGGTAKSNYAAGLVSGMLDAEYPGAGELVSWETGKGLMADQKASVAYKREKAKNAAEEIQD